MKQVRRNIFDEFVKKNVSQSSDNFAMSSSNKFSYFATFRSLRLNIQTHTRTRWVLIYWWKMHENRRFNISFKKEDLPFHYRFGTFHASHCFTQLLITQMLFHVLKWMKNICKNLFLFPLSLFFEYYKWCHAKPFLLFPFVRNYYLNRALFIFWHASCSYDFVFDFFFIFKM